MKSYIWKRWKKLCVAGKVMARACGGTMVRHPSDTRVCGCDERGELRSGARERPDADVGDCVDTMHMRLVFGRIWTVVRILKGGLRLGFKIGTGVHIVPKSRRICATGGAGWGSLQASDKRLAEDKHASPSGRPRASAMDKASALA